jgi:hypothetical protein
LTHDQKTSLAGQLARALAVFCIDEVVVYDDLPQEDARRRRGGAPAARGRGGERGDEAAAAAAAAIQPDGEHGPPPAYTGVSDPAHFLLLLLRYLETPPHFRRAAFPLQPNLRTAGALPSLDMPHHLRADEWCAYREGMVVDCFPLPLEDHNSGRDETNGIVENSSKKEKESKKKKKKDKEGKEGEKTDKKKEKNKRKKDSEQPGTSDTNGDGDGGEEAWASIVDVGLDRPVMLKRRLSPAQRVTIKFPDARAPTPCTAPVLPNGNGMRHPTAPSPSLLSRPLPSSDYYAGTLTTPDAPREEAGFYWGYRHRRAAALSAVFTECPYAGGYDLSFGTSERGVSLNALIDRAAAAAAAAAAATRSPNGRVGTGEAVNGDGREEGEGAEESKDEPPDLSFRHLLVVFGGVAGIEAAFDADPVLAASGQQRSRRNEDGGGGGGGSGSSSSSIVASLFDHWVNICPGQGSRTIRTMEAVWIGLAALKRLVDRNKPLGP